MSKTRLRAYGVALGNLRRVAESGTPPHVLTYPANLPSSRHDVIGGPCACGAWHEWADWMPGGELAREIGVPDDFEIPTIL